MFISPGRNIRSKARIRLVLSHSICFAANKRRRSGGRIDDVMSDLSAFRTAVLIVQCRESRYPPRRSRAAKRALCGVPVDVPGRATHVYASCGTSETKENQCEEPRLARNGSEGCESGFEHLMEPVGCVFCQTSRRSDRLKSEVSAIHRFPRSGKQARTVLKHDSSQPKRANRPYQKVRTFPRGRRPT